MEITIIETGTNHYNLELGISQERTNEMLEEVHKIMDDKFFGGDMTMGELMKKAIAFGNNDNEKGLILFKVGEMMGWLRGQKEKNPIEEVFDRLLRN